ncbi:MULTISPECIES: hypothetical protein [unclassified Pseudoxanthomonas]|uniref:hypothetical protein n=1 Tax=unclassified Pseudoxanthomonas TaxID=2645906 RepID=UPI0030783881
MTRYRTALLLSLALATGPALAQEGISKVNGSVTAEAGQTYGDLETVNGSIRVNTGATAEEVSTVNGAIEVDDKARLQSLGTVNGGIRLGSGVQVQGGIETVNGSVFVDRGGVIGKGVSTVNGGIGLVATQLSGDIETVNGDITVGVNSHVKGGIKVEKNKSMFPVKLGRDPRIIIGPKAVVEGPLVFERPVTLYVHRTAKTGPITGATAKIYDTDTAPTE